jgi:HAD superfamily hydrolase (TIGR01509 family)
MNAIEIKGVALDMDGLMFDTEPLYHRAADTLLKRRGHRYEQAIQRQMMGQTGPKAIQMMIDYYGLTDDWKSVLAESDAIFRGLLREGLRPMPGLLALLDRLDQAGLPYGVATSSRRLFAEEILEFEGVRDRLRFLWTGDDVRHGKPDPEIYLHASRSLGIDAREMLVLEDSGNGTAAALAAEAIVVAVPGELSRSHDFTGAAMIASGLDDPRLLDFLRRHQHRSSV